MISPDMIPIFFQQYKYCLLKVLNDAFIKSKLLDFSFDNCSLVICMNTYHKARKAEKTLNHEIVRSNPIRRRYEAAMKKAYYSFTKHKDFINLAFNFNPEMRINLGLLEQVELKCPGQWFTFALDLYQKVLADTSILEQLFAFNITVDQLRQGRINVKIAQEAYDTLISEIPGAKKLIENRDGLVLELQHIMFELEIICMYALDENPELITELGLPIIHSLQIATRPKIIRENLKKTRSNSLNHAVRKQSQITKSTIPKTTIDIKGDER